MATSIGTLVAHFEANLSGFEAGRRQAEAGLRNSAARMELTERQQARASESLQRQRSAALIRQWNADQRAFEQAEKNKTRAVEQWSRAQVRTQQNAERQKVQAARAAAEAQVQAQQMANRRLSSLYTALSRVATLAFAGIAATVSGLGVAIQRAMTMEALERALTALAGSSEEAQRQLVRLREVAKAPGLGFREAVQGSIRLQAVGLSAQVAERALRAFGNAIAFGGGGKNELDRVTVQLGQLSAKGKVLSQDLRPIIEAAPAVGKALREAFGTIDPEEIGKLNLTMEQFLDRLLSSLEKLPLVTNSSKNAWENFTDSLDEALVVIGRPFLEPLTRALDAVTPLMRRVADQISSLFTMLGRDAVTLWQSLPESTRAAFDDMVNTVRQQGQTVVNWFKENYPLIQQAVSQTLTNIAQFWETYGDNIKQTAQSRLKEVLEVAQLLLQALKGDWKEAWKSLGTIVAAEASVLRNIISFVVRVAIDAAVKQTENIKKAGVTLGEALMDGILAGLNKKKDQILGEIKVFGLNMALELRRIWRISSPSQVFFDIGQDVIEGLRLGLQTGSEDVKKQLADLLEATAGKYVKEPRRPAESAAKQIAAALREQAEALKRIDEQEPAIAGINRLLSDPMIAKRIDERTAALLRQAATLRDQQQIQKDLNAHLERSRQAMFEVTNDALLPQIPVVSDLTDEYRPYLEILREVQERNERLRREILDSIGLPPPPELVFGRGGPTPPLVDIGGGRTIGGEPATRTRERIATVEEQVVRERLEMARQRLRELAYDLTYVMDRAVYDGLQGGLKRGLQSVALGLLDIVRNTFLRQLETAMSEALEGLLTHGNNVLSNLLRKVFNIKLPTPPVSPSAPTTPAAQPSLATTIKSDNRAQVSATREVQQEVSNARAAITSAQTKATQELNQARASQTQQLVSQLQAIAEHICQCSQRGGSPVKDVLQSALGGIENLLSRPRRVETSQGRAEVVVREPETGEIVPGGAGGGGTRPRQVFTQTGALPQQDRRLEDAVARSGDRVVQSIHELAHTTSQQLQLNAQTIVAGLTPKRQSFLSGLFSAALSGGISGSVSAGIGGLFSGGGGSSGSSSVTVRDDTGAVLSGGGATRPRIVGRALGGSVSVGEIYRVNENETEYFLPLQPGRIYNQQQMSEMNQRPTEVTQHFHINVHTAPSNNISSTKSQKQVAEQFAAALQRLQR